MIVALFLLSRINVTMGGLTIADYLFVFGVHTRGGADKRRRVAPRRTPVSHGRASGGSSVTPRPISYGQNKQSLLGAPPRRGRPTHRSIGKGTTNVSTKTDEQFSMHDTDRYADKAALGNKQDPTNGPSTMFVVALVVAVGVVLGLLLWASFLNYSVPTCATNALQCGAS
jgi:hypothetical protein